MTYTCLLRGTGCTKGTQRICTVRVTNYQNIGTRDKALEGVDAFHIIRMEGITYKEKWVRVCHRIGMIPRLFEGMGSLEVTGVPPDK